MFERKKLKHDTQLLCTVIATANQVHENEVDSLVGSSGSSSNSSNSSIEYFSTSESEGDNDNLIELSINHVLSWVRRIGTRLHNKNILFGRRMRIADFTKSECLAHFCFGKVDLLTVANK